MLSFYATRFLQQPLYSIESTMEHLQLGTLKLTCEQENVNHDASCRLRLAGAANVPLPFSSLSVLSVSILL